MKAFTERRPQRIGAVVVIVVLATVAASLALNRSVFASTYPLRARFSDAAGVRPGTEVVLAGVKVGSVSGVRLAGGSVVVAMNIDRGVVLPERTAASIDVQTLLGLIAVRLKPESGWAKPLRSGAMITSTTVPEQFYQLQNTAGNLLARSDASALNKVITDLAAVSKGKQAQVAAIISGLSRFTGVLDARRSELSSLIDAATSLSSTLAESDHQLVQLVENLYVVVSGLAQHSGSLAALVQNIDAVATQTAGVIGANRPQLDSLLSNLSSALSVVSRHQVDLAEGVAYLGSAVKGFSSIGYSGQANTPNTWANVFVNTLGTAGAYGVIGPCGALDQALNLALGPDPLPCSEQTGPPVPAESSAAGAGVGAGAVSARGAGAGGAGAGSAGTAGSGFGGGPLPSLFDPLLVGGAG
jgi:phospholipid/cholesterol/gamma-HCH transport system substrate-binding protein